jgi:hypothetical protein
MALDGRDLPGDEAEALARVGAELAAGVTAAVPGWVVASVERLAVAWSGALDPEVAAAARDAGEQAQREVGPALSALLAADVDDQWTNPMSIVRRAVAHPTAVLRRAGVGEVVRTAEDEARFPDDPYGLTPVTFADLDPSLHDLGLVWGAVKARAHVSRHRRGPAS